MDPPNRPERATTGIGVWCPSDVQPVAVADSVADFVFSEQTANGQAYWSYMQGQRPSSTRAELHAAIIAMFASGAVRVASDSQAVVQ
eukprot:2596881-Alexandrium_andersonii.AAC.1